MAGNFAQHAFVEPLGIPLEHLAGKHEERDRQQRGRRCIFFGSFLFGLVGRGLAGPP